MYPPANTDATAPPNATATSPPPPASPPPPPPPAAPAQGSASGPGSPGAAAGSGTTNPTPGAGAQAPSATPLSAAQAAPQTLDFLGEFQKRYGMTPEQAQVYMAMGWRQAAGQPQQGQPQPQPQPAAQPQTNAFGLAPFNLDLLNFVRRDPTTGQLVPEPGAPPDAVIQVQRYQEQLRQVQQQFWTNPQQFLGPMIQQEAQRVAAQIVEQQFGGYQQRQAVGQIMQANDPFLYARDASGNAVQQFNPATGRMERQLSPEGRYYAQQVNHAATQLGIRDVGAQDQYARAMLAQALIQAQQQRAAAGQQGAAAAAGFIQQQGQVPPPPPPPTNTPAPPQGMDMRALMKQRMESQGITDDVLRNQINRAG